MYQHSHKSFIRLHFSVKVIPCIVHQSPWGTIYKPTVKCAKNWEIETPTFFWVSLLSLSSSSIDTSCFPSNEEIIVLLRNYNFASFWWFFFFLEMIEPEKSIKVMERRTCEYMNKSMMAKLSHGTKKKKKKIKAKQSLFLYYL